LVTAAIYSEMGLEDINAVANKFPSVPLAITPVAEAAAVVVGEEVQPGDENDGQNLVGNLVGLSGYRESSSGIVGNQHPTHEAGEVDGETSEHPIKQAVLEVNRLTDAKKKEWRPQGDSNPCRRRERAVS
jgi:hypothetical protein